MMSQLADALHLKIRKQNTGSCLIRSVGKNVNTLDISLKKIKSNPALADGIVMDLAAYQSVIYSA